MGVIDEEDKILLEIEKKYNLPTGFLIRIIDIEKQNLFQLKRTGTIESIRSLLFQYVGEEK